MSRILHLSCRPILPHASCKDNDAYMVMWVLCKYHKGGGVHFLIRVPHRGGPYKLTNRLDPSLLLSHPFTETPLYINQRATVMHVCAHGIYPQ